MPPVVEPWQTPIKRVVVPKAVGSLGTAVHIMAMHSGGGRDRDLEASSFVEGRLGRILSPRELPLLRGTLSRRVRLQGNPGVT
jgi:hypothetical protein